MNLRIIMKNHRADPEIEFLIKSILKPYGRAAAMPTAWELRISIKIDDVENTRQFLHKSI